MTHEPEGTRIRLRPHGAERWFAAGFLLFWLCGWAAGEVFALWQVFGPKSTPMPTFGTGFLLFWLVGWTFGGLAAVSQVLQLLAGTDELCLRADGLHLRTGVGPLKRSRCLSYSEIRAIEVKDNRLAAETAAGKVVLASRGSAAEREWLGAALRGALGLTSRSTSPPETVNVTQLPPEPRDWLIRREDNGGVVLCRPRKTRIQGAGCLLFFALFWNGIVGAFVAGGLGLISRDRIEGPAEVGSLGYWLFLTPFIAIGLGVLALLLYTLFVTEERYAARNRLEIRRHAFSRQWTEALPAGYFTLESQTSEGSTTYTLVLVSDANRKRLESGDEASLRALGMFLAYHTGWQFRSPDTGVDRR